MKYRKKPIVVEAIQYKGGYIDFDKVQDFVGDKLIPYFYSADEGKWDIQIKTLEGRITASEGDYIVKGIIGEFYPVKPDVFDMTYEKIEE